MYIYIYPTVKVRGLLFTWFVITMSLSFSQAFSIFILCNDQAEVDKYWDALTVDGGTSGRCGWLKDRFGLSWQIIPKQLGECLANSDPVKSAAAMKAMMGMSKIIVSELEAAVNQR